MCNDVHVNTVIKRLKLVCSLLQWGTRFGFLKILVLINHQFPHRDSLEIRLKFNPYGVDSSNVAETVSKSSNFQVFQIGLSYWLNVMRGSLAQSCLLSHSPFPPSTHQLGTNHVKHKVLKHQERCHPLPHTACSLEMLCVLPKGTAAVLLSFLVFGGCRGPIPSSKEKHAIK